MYVRHVLLTVAAALCALAANSVVQEKYTAAERRHWSFQPRSKPVVPSVSGASNPIDAFVLARLQKDGLRFAPPAGKETLIRRVYFDLTGLPPTIAEIDAFVRDKSPGAYEKVVDRLLASSHYGERWAQHWLDVVRFAETDGFEYDTHRTDAWRYRDYVIRSLQADKPYDKFLTEQIAGDEIDPENREYQIASGLQRLGPLRKNAGNQEVASSRNEVLTEMTNVVGSGMLGITLGCARCHDHKFDPIRHTDYYRMQAFFAAVHEKNISMATPEQVAEFNTKKAVVDKEIADLKKQMRGLKGEQRELMLKKVEDAQDKMPDPPPAIFTIANDMSKVTPVNVLARGDYQNKGVRVAPRPLGILVPEDTPEMAPDAPNPRTQLAKFITSPDNPLTARVLVNRLWHYHFGRGIVATPNDFGRMGVRPSHPELLDWLANQFVDGGWRIKPVHKMIVMSQAYRQSSDSPLAQVAQEKDSDNALLWHYPVRRLDAEEIRDAMLTVAGRLNPQAGGPSVIVPVDPDLVNLLYKPSQWAVNKDLKDHDRRSVYLLHKRNLRLPMMEVFDAPDMQISCSRRDSSTHAPQALELMNGEFANDMAKSLAGRLDREAPTPLKQVDLAFRLATGRLPNARERAAALRFLKTQSLKEFALAVLNLNATLYVN